MKCKKCGKKLKNKELFCTICGYYNGELDNGATLVQGDLQNDELGVSLGENANAYDGESVEGIQIDFASNDTHVDASNNTNALEDSSFYYENEAFLEAYIGEDYAQIKKWPFNIWAFILNWIYLLYRKLYVTGIVGLLMSLLFIVFVRRYLIVFFIVTMIALGFLFNYYYVFVAKKKVERIIKRMEGTDNFTLMNIMKEEGGVNVPLALAIYAAFLLVLFFCLVNFKFNSNHNTKYWKENSENRANCSYLIKLAYIDIQKQGSIGKAESAVCRVISGTTKEHEIYIKALYENRSIYVFYATENKKIIYKDNTSSLMDLELLQANTALTPEQSQKMASLKEIENNYQNVYIKAKKEDELIQKRKNTQEKMNYIFDEEEIIR